MAPDPVVRIEPTRLTAEPGGQAVVTVTVFNSGTVVEGYDVDVVSTAPMPWATATPSTLSVYPQQKATTTVTFAPPRGPGVPGGSVAFGVRARSQVDPARSAVAEGDLEVTTVAGLHAELTPVASTGRWRGSHTLKVDNFGNSTARLDLSATDADQALGFLVTPAVLEVPAGGQGYARVKVRTRHPVLRGERQRLPFKVVCTPASATAPGMPGTPGSPPPHAGPSSVSTSERPVVDGAFNQKPILDRWVVLAAGLLIAALVALVVWAVQRDGGDGTGGEDEDRPPAPDQPTGLAVEGADGGVMALTWDRVGSATGYRIVMTRPTSDAFDGGQPLASDPERVEFRAETDRAGEYCYTVVALREGAAASVPSEEDCAESTFVDGEATPTAAPSIVPAPGFESGPSPTTTGSADPTDPTDPTDTASPSDTTTPTDPAGAPRFLTLLTTYDSGGVANAEAAAERARDAGLTDVRLGVVEDLGIELPDPGLTRVLYVVGNTRDAAEEACRAVQAAEPSLVQLGCLPRFTYELPESASP